jgi:hypothetical protein
MSDSRGFLWQPPDDARNTKASTRATQRMIMSSPHLVERASAHAVNRVSKVLLNRYRYEISFLRPQLCGFSTAVRAGK